MQKILLVRNDKLGDFMLAWPAFAMLKQSQPEWQLFALVPEYTAALAQICPYLDGVIIDAGKKGNQSAQAATLAEIKAQKFDAVINFFSDRYNACLMWKARIPYRLAPATKIIQFLYHHRVRQRRSKSLKPEFVYNLELAQAFLQKQQIKPIEVKPPYLQFPVEEIQAQRQKLIQQLGFSEGKKWFFVHSGSGGSANNLNLNQYADLIQGILAQFDVEIILTAGPNEEQQAQQLAQLIERANVKIYAKNDGLVDFARSLACANLFIAGSTGPLHLAAALNCPTIGFFPSKRSATPLRWQPINAPELHLAFSPEQGKTTEDDLSHISIEQALQQIIPFVQNSLYLLRFGDEIETEENYLGREYSRVMNKTAAFA